MRSPTPPQHSVRGRTSKGGGRPRLLTGADPGITSYSGTSALEPRDADVAPIPGPPAAPVDTKGSVLDPAHRALSIGIVSVVLLIAFEATAVGTAMPVAARELDGIPLYAFAFSAYFTTSLFGMVLAGQWSDRSGPLAPLTAGISAFAAGLLLSGTAGGMWQFILGLGRAGPRRRPRHRRPVRDRQPRLLRTPQARDHGRLRRRLGRPLRRRTPRRRNRHRYLGWRWVFVGIPALVVFPLALALPAIRRTASGPADPSAPLAPWDRRRILLALGVAGAALLQYAGQELRWLSLLPAAAGLALLVPAVRGLLPRGTYRAARGLPSVILLRGIAAGSFIAAESFVPLMLVSQRGLSPTLAGLSLAVGGLTWALGSWIQARPWTQPYRERLTVLGMLLVALAIAAAPSVLITSVPVWAVAVAWAFGCLGMGAVISSTSVLLMKLSAPEEVGANSAALQISDGLSNVLLLAVGGAAFAALGGGAVGHAMDAGAATGSHPTAFAAVFLPMAGVAAVGAWVATRLHATPARTEAAKAR
ncbi:MFS transporter [Streptomyces tanashiensis]